VLWRRDRRTDSGAFQYRDYNCWPAAPESNFENLRVTQLYDRAANGTSPDEVDWISI